MYIYTIFMSIASTGCNHEMLGTHRANSCRTNVHLIGHDLPLWDPHRLGLVLTRAYNTAKASSRLASTSKSSSGRAPPCFLQEIHCCPANARACDFARPHNPCPAPHISEFLFFAGSASHDDLSWIHGPAPLR